MTEHDLESFEKLRKELCVKAHGTGEQSEHEVWGAAATAVGALVDEINRLYSLYPGELEE